MESSSIKNTQKKKKGTLIRNAAYLIPFSIHTAVVARRPSPRFHASHA